MKISYIQVLQILENQSGDGKVEFKEFKVRRTRPGCFCAKDCRDSVEMYMWWYTFTCTGGGGL